MSGGCARFQVPRIDPSGERFFLPPGSPVVAGTPFDAATFFPRETISISPGAVIAPVGSEVVLTAGVISERGTLTPGQTMEWMLSQESAGQFVVVGDDGAYDLLKLPRNKPRKLDNTYAVGSTTHAARVLTRGTANPADDVTVQRGQSWVSVSSASEGSSHVTVFSPLVRDWNRRTASAVIHWIDAQWAFPPPAINPVGRSHTFTTTVSRQTDGLPVAGWIVRYEILGGPPAGFAPDGAPIVEVPTDGAGRATVEIQQIEPRSGSSRVGIQVIRPPQPSVAGGQRLIIGAGTTTKTWTAPELGLRVSGPAEAGVGSTLNYRIDVSNPGDLPSEGVVVTDALPDGATFLSSNPPAETRGGSLEWNLATLSPRQTQSIEVSIRADRAGTINHCATARSAAGLTATDCAATNVALAQLDVRLTGPQTAGVGSSVRFEVVVYNPGSVPATGLVVTDRFDDGFEHPVAESPIERDMPDILPGGSQRIFITFRITKAGQLCHTVGVSGDGGVQGTAQACLAATAAQPPPMQPPQVQPPLEMPRPTDGQAAMEVSKTGPKQLRVGDAAQFHILIKNTGEVPLTNLKIVDRYDLSLDPVQATDGFTVGADELVWTLARLDAGKSFSLQVNCQCLAAARQACNRVMVTSDQRGPLAAEACLEVLPAAEPEPDEPPIQPPAGQLQLSVTELADPVSPGRPFDYRIFVTNESLQSVKGVQLTLILPPEIQLVSEGVAVRAPVRYEAEGQALRFEPVAELRARQGDRAETLTYNISVQAAKPGQYKLRAELRAEGLTEPILDEETTDVIGMP